MDRPLNLKIVLCDNLETLMDSAGEDLSGNGWKDEGRELATALYEYVVDVGVAALGASSTFRDWHGGRFSGTWSRNGVWGVGQPVHRKSEEEEWEKEERELTVEEEAFFDELDRICERYFEGLETRAADLKFNVAGEE